MNANFNFSAIVNTLNNYDDSQRHYKMLCVSTANGFRALEILDKSKLNFIQWFFFTFFKIPPKNQKTSLKEIAKLIIDFSKKETVQTIQQNPAPQTRL